MVPVLKKTFLLEKGVPDRGDLGTEEELAHSPIANAVLECLSIWQHTDTIQKNSTETFFFFFTLFSSSTCKSIKF